MTLRENGGFFIAKNHQFFFIKIILFVERKKENDKIFEEYKIQQFI